MWARETQALLAALAFLTRLPVPARFTQTPVGLPEAARYLPVIGWIVGGIAAGVYGLATLLWPPMVAVLLSVVVTIALTGGLHEDGLADTADGLGGGWTRARILEIMKDSRVGSYGVIALWLALSGRFVLLLALPVAWVPWVLLAGQTVSRAGVTGVMAALPYARADAESKSAPMARPVSPGTRVFALACTIPVLIPLGGGAASAGVVLAGLAVWVLVLKLRRWLGGYTGDTLGAAQQLGELGFYLGVLAVLHASANA